ncbi:SDR family oxidoreductase [Parahaliea maris]|uniref:SDR family oxidoreductase n=1 Tax=Parahaliea maris TaxID=2716870 RepID=A0A5C8ZTV2_9GAMM|nr:SDR family NAD(P)-dependent oxidoreductase [Parahaliea maris]TXS91886.1 SDR family oxidoreductase [Parahaliea maris]
MTTERTERVIVSGATSGIGRAIAIRLASRAAVVGVMGRREEAAREVAAQVEELGCKAEVLQADVSQPSAVEDAIGAFVAKYGGIDTVVSSAGIALTGLVNDFGLDAWDQMISTNLSGTFYLAKYTLPELIKTRGTFTAISSDAGTQGAQEFAAYCATKHGVNGLIKAMALDYGASGVRCNAVCPGFVETPMADQLLDGMSTEEVDYYKKSVPLGRFARPEEVANVVAHLSSTEAAYSHGMIYALDGGATSGYYSAPA